MDTTYQRQAWNSRAKEWTRTWANEAREVDADLGIQEWKLISSAKMISQPGTSVLINKHGIFGQTKSDVHQEIIWDVFVSCGIGMIQCRDLGNITRTWENIYQIVEAQPIRNARATIMRFWFWVWSSFVECFCLEFKGKRWSFCSLCWLKGCILTTEIIHGKRESSGVHRFSPCPASGQSNDCTYWRPDMDCPGCWSCQWQVTSQVNEFKLDRVRITNFGRIKLRGGSRWAIWK